MDENINQDLAAIILCLKSTHVCDRWNVILKCSYQILVSEWKEKCELINLQSKLH